MKNAEMPAEVPQNDGRSVLVVYRYRRCEPQSDHGKVESALIPRTATFIRSDVLD